MMMNIRGHFWVILKFKWNGQKNYEMLEARWRPPCTQKSTFSEFVFWVGNLDVTSTQIEKNRTSMLSC
jgi:hypothetical protein